MSNTFFYGDGADQFTFFRIPKALIVSPRYRAMSAEAKLLYSLLMDRMSLSIGNGWLDNNGRVYIYYTVEAVANDLNVGRCKAIRMFDELDIAGLIERVRQGRGFPARIYVKRFTDEDPGEKKYQNKVQSGLKTSSHEVSKWNPNNTEKNKTEKNNTELSIYPSCREQASEQLAEQLNLPYLNEQHPYDDVDQLVDLIADAVCSSAKTIRIGKDNVPVRDVIKRFSGLDYSHIEYVLDSLRENQTKIRNIKNYLLTALYNAPLTIGQYYYAAANEAAKGVS